MPFFASTFCLNEAHLFTKYALANHIATTTYSPCYDLDSATTTSCYLVFALQSIIDIVHSDWAPAWCRFSLSIAAFRGAFEAIAFQAAGTALIFVSALIRSNKFNSNSNCCLLKHWEQSSY